MARHTYRDPSRLVSRALAIPVERSIILTALEPPSLVKRNPADAASSSSVPTKTCGPDDTTGVCTRPVNSTTTLTLPIVLGAVIPLTCAFIAFFFLHRRHVKKLRLEDANDKHKSLDFGLDFVPSGSNNNRRGNGGTGPSMAEKSTRRGGHGVSMDLTLNSPYLLPPGLHGSHESIHSLSRSLHGEDDKYRHASAFPTADSGSIRSCSPSFKRGGDDASSHNSPSSKYPYGDDMNQHLLKNAQRMSRSPPAIELDPIESDLGHPPHHATAVSASESGNTTFHGRSELTVPTAVSSHGDRSSSSSSERDDSVLRKSNNYLGALIQRGDDRSPENDLGRVPVTTKADVPLDEPKIQEPVPDNTSKSPPPAEVPATGYPSPSQPPRISLPIDDDKSDYGDESEAPKRPVPQLNIQDVETAPPSNDKAARATLDPHDHYYDGGYQIDTRRLTVGIPPLPPEDPSDNPEQRANRIRSFYKEYFDESKPQDDYVEDHGPGGADYGPFDPYGDPGHYAHPRPFAQPEGRRAMTPPPRMPQIPVQYRRPGPGFGPPSTSSRSGTPSFSSGPRAFSSASGRIPVRGPRKPLPPPSPLHILPTPHKLKDDSILPIDFAPGANSRERREGRPETPQGGVRPYMLTVPAHVPLASSYDDLAMLPSPHALRKSGTFTALDFVPPPRFKNADSGSDAGSIRSNRTGLSAAQSYSIRTGAYRISRLPPQTVGTKDDIISNLRPTWDMKT
ncbi:conserved hypothetical protein [Coccidioides posadasii str. Silveira]|uniref:Uncharacterized protein n=1 Tax=Coccidioides posadasii (strain RMSCC 757 / Silveira) TaxID=443226 RepID=E9D0K9_COCPS|nr:conserved hypothetical protein [Coccidioides posadasii str. Silveira]